MKKKQGMVWLMIVIVTALVSCGKVEEDDEYRHNRGRICRIYRLR